MLAFSNYREFDMRVNACNICRRALNRDGDPLSRDCGGDCLACMAEAGDPECIASVAAIKPNIEDVCMAFFKFNSDNLTVLSRRPHAEWKQAFAENQAALKAKLEKWFLAEHIDWTNSN